MPIKSAKLKTGCDHAFPFGHINANGVHYHSSNTNNLQPEPIFFSLPIQSIG